MRFALIASLLTCFAATGCGAIAIGEPDSSRRVDGSTVDRISADVSTPNDISPTDDITPTNDTPPPPTDTGPCVPTVPSGGEATNALCSDGVDNDCNGYIDCNDFHCSRNAAITVCATGHDGGTDSGHDAGTDGGRDAGMIMPGTIGPTGGTVDLLHFSVFGDVRPPSNNDTTGYPTTQIQSVMRGMQTLGTQFAIASGDYMFASTSTAVDAQIALFQSAESAYHNHIFHGMGNHECNGSTTSNCPLGNEYPNVIGYLSILNSSYGGLPYFDWVVHTRLGDAHFISTAPNAWSTAQHTWLTRALAQSAMYTFVIAHEGPNTLGPPAGSATIESLIALRTGGVTLRLYGHTHEYYHMSGADFNAVVDGNAGAPFDGSAAGGQYLGFGVIDQRADGNIVFTAYQVGSPPMVNDSWVVTPAGIRSL
jgi:hypothetical protein